MQNWYFIKCELYNELAVSLVHVADVTGIRIESFDVANGHPARLRQVRPPLSDCSEEENVEFD